MEPDLGEQQAKRPANFPRNGDIAFMQALLPLFSFLVTVIAQRRLVSLCSNPETGGGIPMLIQAQIWSKEAQ